jgi:hypothetical protein
MVAAGWAWSFGRYSERYAPEGTELGAPAEQHERPAARQQKPDSQRSCIEDKSGEMTPSLA